MSLVNDIDLTPMTDEQIQELITDWIKDMQGEWMDVLIGMWQAVGKVPDAKQLTQYARQLRFIPLGLLERTCERAVRDNGVYHTVPTIGAVWAALRKELDQPHMDIQEAITHWMDLQWAKVARRF